MRRKRPAKPIVRIDQVLDIQDYLKYKNERDYILFVVGITTGYRADDLVTLKARDIRESINKSEFTIFEGKKKNSKILEKKTGSLEQ